MLRVWQEFWQQRAPREQALLRWGGLLALLLVLYLLVGQLNLRWPQTSRALDASPQALDLLAEQAQRHLRPVQPMTADRWRLLLREQGWRETQVLEQDGGWQVSGQVQGPRQVEALLIWAQQQGWLWTSVALEGQPLQVRVQLVAFP